MEHSSDLVTIYTVYDPIQAELIRGMLASEGIESFLKSDHAGGVLSYLTMISGIDLWFIRKMHHEPICSFKMAGLSLIDVPSACTRSVGG